jgi:hypothetical protein
MTLPQRQHADFIWRHCLSEILGLNKVPEEQMIIWLTTNYSRLRRLGLAHTCRYVTFITESKWPLPMTE